MKKQVLDLLTIGEAMVELSCDGDIRFATAFSRTYGGDAFNTAVAAARLGSKTGFLTRMGEDPFAQALTYIFRKEGIVTFKHRPDSGPTGLYFIRYNANGERDYLYYRKESAASQLHVSQVTPEIIATAGIVYSTGITLALSEKSRESVFKAFTLARQNHVMTAFDPNYRAKLWHSEGEAFDVMNKLLPMVDVVFPSFPDDTSAFLGFKRPEQLMDYYWSKGIQLVVIKAGENGCYIGMNRQIQHIPTQPTQPVDATGAGDVFNGAFLHGMANRRSLADCANLGNIAAGLKIQNKGTLPSIPYRDAVYAKAFPNER